MGFVLAKFSRRDSTLLEVQSSLTKLIISPTQTIISFNMQLAIAFLAITALLTTALAMPAGGNKPTGGPAAAQVTIYPGGANPYTCAAADQVRYPFTQLMSLTDPRQPPPKDGSIGTGKVITVAET